MQTATLHSIEARQGATAEQFPTLESVTRPTVDTAAAAYYMNRRPQTMRSWASTEAGPLRPIRKRDRHARARPHVIQHARQPPLVERGVAHARRAIRDHLPVQPRPALVEQVQLSGVVEGDDRARHGAVARAFAARPLGHLFVDAVAVDVAPGDAHAPAHAARVVVRRRDDQLVGARLDAKARWDHGPDLELGRRRDHRLAEVIVLERHPPRVERVVLVPRHQQHAITHAAHR